MDLSQRLLAFLSPALHWWRTVPMLGCVMLLTSTVAILICQWLGYDHSRFWTATDAIQMAQSRSDLPEWVLVYHYLSPYLDLMTKLSIIMTLLYSLRAAPSARRMILPLTIVGGLLLVSTLCEEVHDTWVTASRSRMGEPFDLLAYIGKLIMIAILCLTPAVSFWWYSRRSSLERYTLRTFLQPLCFCFIAFFSLFILMDLISNMREYQDNQVPFTVVLKFYWHLMPSVFVMVAPWATLMATLFSLVKMSRFNEIISMLSAGRSLWQIGRPLLVVGFIVSLLAMAMNYHWAPHAEAQRTALTEVVNSKSRTRQGNATIANTVLHYNPDTRRLWFIGRVPFDTGAEALNHVEVRQFDSKGRVEHAWLGRSGKWWWQGMWSLNNGIEIAYKDGVQSQPIEFERHGTSTKGSTYTRLEFQETPWSIISAALVPDDLGVTELLAFLQANSEELGKERIAPFRTHLADRFARPWLALLMVFCAVPLGVAYSRRAALGGMAGAMALVAGLLFLPELFMNMGKGGHASPRLAVWLSHIIFLVCGGLMFWLKSLNKEIPRFSLANILRWLKALQGSK